MCKKDEILGSILYLINKTFTKYPDTEKIMGTKGHLENVRDVLVKKGVVEVPNYLELFEEHANDQLPGVMMVEDTRWALKYYSDIAFLYGVMLIIEDDGKSYEETSQEISYFFRLLKQLISKIKYQVDQEGKEFWIFISSSFFGYYTNIYKGTKNEAISQKAINLCLESLGLPKIFVEGER